MLPPAPRGWEHKILREPKVRNSRHRRDEISGLSKRDVQKRLEAWTSLATRIHPLRPVATCVAGRYRRLGSLRGVALGTISDPWASVTKFPLRACKRRHPPNLDLGGSFRRWWTVVFDSVLTMCAAMFHLLNQRPEVVHDPAVSGLIFFY